MRKVIYLLIPGLLTWILLSNSGGVANRQAVDRTGSPLGTGSCGSCHSGGNFSPTLSIQLLDGNTPVTRYSPGKVYEARVSIAASNNPRGYGFQLVALSGAGNIRGGTFGDAPAGFSKVTLANRVYVEQSSVRSSPVLSIPWTAPAAGSGSVRFYSAGLAVNGNGGTGGDSPVQLNLPVIIDEDASSISLSSSAVAFPAEGGTQSVTISSNTNWTVSESLAYLAVSPTSGSLNGTIAIQCNPNTSTVARTGTIAVSGTGATTRIITVTQAGQTPVLNVGPTQLDFPDTGGVLSLDITSNLPWTLAESMAHISIDTPSASGNRKVTVRCLANPSATRRTGTITLSATGMPSRSITVNQAAAPPTLSLLPNTLAYDPTGGNKTISITSNTSWTVSEALAYLSVSPTSGSGNRTITVSCQSNTSLNARTGVILVASPGLDTQRIDLTQEGATKSITLTPSSMAFPPAGGSQRANIVSNTAWKVGSNVTFLRIDSTTGLNNGGFQVVCDSNLTALTRTGIITVSGESAVARTLAISQTGVAGFLTISPDSLNFGANGSILLLTVKSNTNFTLSENLDYITLSKTSGSLVDTIRVTCIANPTVNSRSGSITISGTGVTSRSIPIKQAGATPQLVASPMALNFNANGGSINLAITSNTTWTVADTVPFLSNNIPSGSGNRTVSISCQANPLALSRTTEVFITAQGLPVRKIPVTQTGATANLTLGSTSLQFQSSGGEKSFTINTNTSWIIVDTFPFISFSPLNGIGQTQVKVTCEPNMSTSLRSFSIPVTGTGVAAVRTLFISQSGAPEVFTVNPATISFGLSGGTKTIEVQSNTAWSLAESSSFVTVGPASGEFNRLVTVVCDTNFSAVPRSGKLVFSGKGDAAITVAISQAGAIPVFRVSPDSVLADTTAMRATLKIAGNTGWTISKDVGWFTLNTVAGTGDYNLLLSVEENPVMQERLGRILIRSTQLDSTRTIMVRQRGKRLLLPQSWQVNVTPLFHTLFLPANLISQIEGQALRVGDFVGVFFTHQGRETCAGYGAWTGQTTSFRVFGDNPATSTMKEGLAEGEAFVCKIWRVGKGDVLSVKAEFAPLGTQGIVIATDRFTGSGISMISRLSTTGTSTIQPLQTIGLVLFPNPAQTLVQIKALTNLPGKAQLEWFNPLGQRLQQLAFPEGLPEGGVLTLDFSSSPPGIYPLRWIQGGRVWHGSVSIVR